MFDCQCLLSISVSIWEYETFTFKVDSSAYHDSQMSLDEYFKVCPQYTLVMPPVCHNHTHSRDSHSHIHTYKQLRVTN